MKNKIFLLVLGELALVGLFFNFAWADSLWHDQASPYAAPHAKQVGDVITIIIEENSRSTLGADTKAKKSSEVSSDLITAWRRVAALLEGGGEQRTVGQGKVIGGSKFLGSGQTSRSAQVRAVMSAVIANVKPNGNFELRGEKKVKINEEVETINISGEIRPQDVTSDNTIFSSQIANAQIVIEGSGTVGNQQSPGIITRFLNWLF